MCRNGVRLRLTNICRGFSFCLVSFDYLTNIRFAASSVTETGLAAHKACLVNVPTLLPPRISVLASNGGNTYHRGSHVSAVFRPSTGSTSTPPSVFSSLGNHHQHYSQQQHRISRNTSSVSTDSANSTSVHLRTSSNSIEGADVFVPKPTVVITLEPYSGDPQPPPLVPFGDSPKPVKPLIFGVGEKIILLQPFDGARWLQVS